MPAVLKRPHPLALQATRPDHPAGEPAAPTATVFSLSTSPVAAQTAAIVCERLWVSAPNTIIDLVLLP